MFTTTKGKWLTSIILAGILLALSLAGSKWGMINSAQASVNAPPVINFLNPGKVPAGSPDKTVVIGGANFGTNPDCVTIWLKDLTHDYALYPDVVIDNGISVVINASYLVVPNHYLLAVIRGTCYSIPPVPPDPEWDQVSTPADFTVYEPIHSYIPLIEQP